MSTVKDPIGSRKRVAQAIAGDLWSTNGIAEKHSLRVRHCFSVIRSIEGSGDKQPVAAKQIYHITWHGVAPRKKCPPKRGTPYGTLPRDFWGSFASLIPPR